MAESKGAWDIWWMGEQFGTATFMCAELTELTEDFLKLKQNKTKHKEQYQNSSNKKLALGISHMDHGFLIFGLQRDGVSCKECPFSFLAEFSTF